MSIRFLQHINDLIIETDTDESEILALVGQDGFLTAQEIEDVKTFIQDAIADNRKARLDQVKADFIRNRAQASKKLADTKRDRSLSDMLGDIVKAMQNTDRVPEGILLAFREQSTNQAASEQDIRDIWESLLQLGLIDIEGNQEE